MSDELLKSAMELRYGKQLADYITDLKGKLERAEEENERLQMANKDAVAWEEACKADLDTACQIIADLAEYAECNDPNNPHLARAKVFFERRGQKAMSDFYCGGCCKWARSPHDCPGRPGKVNADQSGEGQRQTLLRRKAELERELKEVNLRLEGVV